MATWTCPECDRRFSARGRGHICKPGTTIDELAERSIPTFRPIVERVREHLESLPPLDDELIVDPLDSLVQFKHRKVFAMVRPMTKWSAVAFHLDRRVESDRLSRKVVDQGGVFHHVVNVHTVEELDEQLLEWLTEAYDPSLVDRQARPSADDPMVPDDVDADLW
ncbi:MAG: DUF5655 domain-containing protein [Actinomycetota bacterium]